MNERRGPFISTVIEMELTTVLHALADPARLRIVRALAEREEVPCGSFGLGLAPSTMSHHLVVLRDAGLVETRREGRAKLNTLRRAEIDERFPGLLATVLAATPSLR
jgi:DNA-binding transcriptional ArsR family regulator